MAKESVPPAKQNRRPRADGKKRSVPPPADVFTLQITWRAGADLRPEDILSDVPQPGFGVRFRQALLNAETEAFLTVRPAAGKLTLQIRITPSVATVWYQDADSWLQQAAITALKEPGQAVRARDTPRGVIVEARFEAEPNDKPLAQDRNVWHKKRALSSFPSMSQVPPLLDAIVAALPADPREQLPAIAALYAALQERIAPRLTTTITALVQGSEVLSYDEKAALARAINDVLSDTRLAIRDPKTNLPATLLAHRPKVSAPTSYLRIWDTRKADDGKRHFCKLEEVATAEAGLQLIDERSRSDPQKG